MPRAAGGVSSGLRAPHPSSWTTSLATPSPGSAARPGRAVLCKHPWPPSKPPHPTPSRPGRWASVCRMVRSREVILSRPSAGPSCLQPGTGLPFPFLICSGIKCGACFKVSRPPRPLGLPERGPGNVLGSGGHPGEGM